MTGCTRCFKRIVSRPWRSKGDQAKQGKRLVVDSPMEMSEGRGSIQDDGQRRQEGNLPHRLESTGSS